MYKIVVTDTAQKDLQNAVSYITNEFRGNKFILLSKYIKSKLRRPMN
jgi:hypothetical protein